MAVTDQFAIVQMLPALEAGGVERGTLEIAEAIVARGHRSIVVSAGGSLTGELIARGSEHIYMPVGKKSPLTFRYILQLRKFLRDNPVAILHARSRLPAWISYLAWRGMAPRGRPRFVTSVHGPYSVNRYSRIMVRGEKVIAVSNFIKSYITENYPGIDPADIITIPRGIETALFPWGFQPGADWLARWRNQHPELEGKFIITLPARLTRWKGHADFLQVIARLRGAGNIHGLVVGGHDPTKRAYLDELLHTVRQNGLQERISFTGHRPDIREIMSISDVVLSLSTEPEAFGRTSLEALSLGVPVVGYEHGGVGEVMRTIFPRGLVTPGRPGAVAERIMTFMHDRPKVPEHHPYTLQRMQTATLELYEQMASSRARENG